MLSYKISESGCPNIKPAEGPRGPIATSQNWTALVIAVYSGRRAITGPQRQRQGRGHNYKMPTFRASTVAIIKAHTATLFRLSRRHGIIRPRDNGHSFSGRERSCSVPLSNLVRCCFARQVVPIVPILSV